MGSEVLSIKDVPIDNMNNSVSPINSEYSKSFTFPDFDTPTPSPMNHVLHGDEFPVHHYPDSFVIPMTLFMALVMAVAFVGNSMTLLTIWRHRGMRTRTNMFVANLAIADIMVAIVDIPAAMVTLVKGTWIFGWAGCYINGFTVGLGLMLSVHTLMWIR